MFNAINKYADFYFNFMVGEYPENHKDYKKTANLFEYLKDSGLTDNEIYKIIKSVKPKTSLAIDDIPEEIRKNSLIEKDKFYFHKELIITPPPPGWNTDDNYNFYREIKIRYTLDNALDYFIRMTRVKADWISRDKEIGSIKYLLKEYKKFNFIEPLDFLLHLIDYCVSDNMDINSIYDLRHKEIELAELLEIDIANAIARGKNTIIWRS